MAEESKTSIQGNSAELDACSYLQKQGLDFVEKNYRCLCGEIDLIMRDGAELVFVEVRLRRQEYLGSAIESITRGKQLKVMRAAKLYLLEKNLMDKVNFRFDAIGINDKQQFDWIPNAFSEAFI